MMNTSNTKEGGLLRGCFEGLGHRQEVVEENNTISYNANPPSFFCYKIICFWKQIAFQSMAYEAILNFYIIWENIF
jgi:hypothetical protein